MKSTAAPPLIKEGKTKIGKGGVAWGWRVRKWEFIKVFIHLQG